MPSPTTCRNADLDRQIAEQRAAIARFEAALWGRAELPPLQGEGRGGDGFPFQERLLPSYQSAWRRLEGLLEQRGDPRHFFLIVLPVADSPLHLQDCLDSLLHLCRAYGYGGFRDGRWRKLAVLLADDSGDRAAIRRHQEIARDFDAAGLTVHYFGLEQQLQLLDGLEPLPGILGCHERSAFHHKGQAMMRNLAYLKSARLIAAMPEEDVLVYTIDADQEFKVNVATPEGGKEVAALNTLFHLDALFRDHDIQVLTGKVVGDPPVSPAVMAGKFLEDVIGFVEEMAQSRPDAAYPQPSQGGGGDAAYHDMADLFGFHGPSQRYRYHCPLPGTPDRAACFAEFARRLNGFFHGEHPTRVTWYEPGPLNPQPARTVYTGNYVFRPEALTWFIPFAPLRLRMSGPTMGRLLKAELGSRFVSANLPMLHKRTVEATGQSEFRPGVREEQRGVDLSGEFERQFHGDVMLFAMERLTELGYPGKRLEANQIASVFNTVQEELQEKYQRRHAAIRLRIAALQALLGEPGHWWHDQSQLQWAVAEFLAFSDNLTRNFGVDSEAIRRIDDPLIRRDWRDRQMLAIAAWPNARHTWACVMDQMEMSSCL